MKKKIVTVFIAMVMALSTFGGCGAVKAPQIPVKIEPHAYSSSVVDDFIKTHPNFDGYEEEPAAKGGFFANAFSKSTVNNAIYCEESVCEAEACFDPYFEVIPFNTEEYSPITENGFHSVMFSPLSTFAADVDTASYSNVRRYIESGYRLDEIPKGAVRTEEMINYFSYNYKLPENNEPFGVTAEIGDCPWNENSKLVTIGLQTGKIDFSESPSSNIVFLIDVSGSMDMPNKLPLLIDSFVMMLDELTEKDRVSIVTYAGSDTIVLEGVPGSEKETIERALRSLTAGGCTNGGQGIVSAYKLAEQNFIKEGNNRVIIATDGDLNVGITNASDLKDLIKKESETGVYLTVLGFGMGNYSDTNLETIADSGNGNYAYIDNLTEAQKVLCDELGATMVTVAKDVKIQVEFNPAVVAEYRLIGYEDRELSPEDFNDDTKDAGEIGAGHSVTAMYEIVTVDKYKGSDSELKYQKSSLSDKALESDEWLTVSFRYKAPNENTSKLFSYPVGSSDYKEINSDDFYFATTVAEFAQILRNEDYVGTASLNDVLERTKKLELDDQYKEEFKLLVMKLINRN